MTTSRVSPLYTASILTSLRSTTTTPTESGLVGASDDGHPVYYDADRHEYVEVVPRGFAWGVRTMCRLVTVVFAVLSVLALLALGAGADAWSTLGFVWVGWLVIRTIVMIPVWLLKS